MTIKTEDTRTVIRFATFPVLIDREWVWWKYYRKYQRCRRIHVEGQWIAPGWTEEDSTHLIWETYKKERV